ncbi:hypothetical protein RRG08_062023 [Elysia crispata]|uniref:Uncharacterized protein n=1 Tax=Elysia crispata TaxID=231223 RepID=A0AAE1A505_9GAST|nr:hypothetical protein RRG08_062023 [Elysia crispata]
MNVSGDETKGTCEILNSRVSAILHGRRASQTRHHPSLVAYFMVRQSLAFRDPLALPTHFSTCPPTHSGPAVRVSVTVNKSAEVQNWIQLSTAPWIFHTASHSILALCGVDQFVNLCFYSISQFLQKR